jgi:hypothetical protein
MHYNLLLSDINCQVFIYSVNLEVLRLHKRWIDLSGRGQEGVFGFFFTYDKSVWVNKLNVVNHSHSYIHKKSICIIVNSLGCQGYSLRFANQSKYRSEYCRPIKSFFSHACDCFHTLLKEDLFQSRVKTITSVERKLLIGRQYSERYIDWFANFNE